MKERTTLLRALDAWKAVQGEFEDAKALLELAVEAESQEEAAEIVRGLDRLESLVTTAELTRMFKGEHDDSDAIIEIHPGAGGTEAQDWASMLFRMYSRWIERKGLKSEVLDTQPGEEAGLKSVTFTAEGTHAYGMLKAEMGIHRLVRISPFDAQARRHTSFASVFVYPDIEEEIEVEINDEDLRIDTFRAGGAGGQHVNKTESAIRITHIPTGIVVQCQNERSQHKNKALAMKVLKARLYQYKLQEQKVKMDQFHSQKKDIAWGSQIRSYVLQPYRMVKDLRTGVETGNTDAVLDGEIDKFITAYLLSDAGQA